MAISEENIKIIFGLKLKQLRSETNMSLQELAKTSGLSASYINEIEKGKKKPKADKVILLAQALNVPYDDLVSTRLNRQLSPIGQLLNSGILKELPLQQFGIEKGKLIEIISNAPDRVGAFISSILHIAQNYNLQQEHFYYATLRAYQEMHDNFFPELEEEAQAFLDSEVDLNALPQLLEKRFHIKVHVTDFADYPDLKGLRSVTDAESGRLFINSSLTSQQQCFLVAKEIGFQYLGIEARPWTTSWTEVKSFDQVLNNFKASYFASALMMPLGDFKATLEHLFKQKKDINKLFGIAMQEFNVSEETFVQRMCNVLVRHFGVDHLFFLRYNSRGEGLSNRDVSKELHISKESKDYMQQTEEQLFIRAVSLHHLEATPGSQRAIKWSTAQDPSTKRCYAFLHVVRPQADMHLAANCITLGFELNDSIKRKMPFVRSTSLERIDLEADFKASMMQHADLVKQGLNQRRLQQLDALYKS